MEEIAVFEIETVRGHNSVETAVRLDLETVRLGLKTPASESMFAKGRNLKGLAVLEHAVPGPAGPEPVVPALAVHELAGLAELGPVVLGLVVLVPVRLGLAVHVLAVLELAVPGPAVLAVFGPAVPELAVLVLVVLGLAVLALGLGTSQAKWTKLVKCRT